MTRNHRAGDEGDEHGSHERREHAGRHKLAREKPARGRRSERTGPVDGDRWEDCVEPDASGQARVDPWLGVVETPARTRGQALGQPADGPTVGEGHPGMLEGPESLDPDLGSPLTRMSVTSGSSARGCSRPSPTSADSTASTLGVAQVALQGGLRTHCGDRGRPGSGHRRRGPADRAPSRQPGRAHAPALAGASIAEGSPRRSSPAALGCAAPARHLARGRPRVRLRADLAGQGQPQRLGDDLRVEALGAGPRTSSRMSGQWSRTAATSRVAAAAARSSAGTTSRVRSQV